MNNFSRRLTYLLIGPMLFLCAMGPGLGGATQNKKTATDASASLGSQENPCPQISQNDLEATALLCDVSLVREGSLEKDGLAQLFQAIGVPSLLKSVTKSGVSEQTAKTLQIPLFLVLPSQALAGNQAGHLAAQNLADTTKVRVFAELRDLPCTSNGPNDPCCQKGKFTRRVSAPLDGAEDLKNIFGSSELPRGLRRLEVVSVPYIQKLPPGESGNNECYGISTVTLVPSQALDMTSQQDGKVPPGQIKPNPSLRAEKNFLEAQVRDTIERIRRGQYGRTEGKCYSDNEVVDFADGKKDNLEKWLSFWDRLKTSITNSTQEELDAKALLQEHFAKKETKVPNE